MNFFWNRELILRVCVKFDFDAIFGQATIPENRSQNYFKIRGSKVLTLEKLGLEGFEKVSTVQNSFQ